MGTATVAAIAALLIAAQPTPSVKGIDRVAWLQGCWETASGDRSVEEQWMAPRGGSMLGVSRTVRANGLAAYELIVLRERGDRLLYHAHPSGQPAAIFMSTVVGRDTVIFENLEHDFPQRIGYQRKGAMLLAWIEGLENGRARRIEFPYRHVACADAVRTQPVRAGRPRSSGGPEVFQIPCSLSPALLAGGCVRVHWALGATGRPAIP